MSQAIVIPACLEPLTHERRWLVWRREQGRGTNRARDNWRVLKAIAIVAGGKSPDHIDEAAKAAPAPRRMGAEKDWASCALDVQSISQILGLRHAQ
jgi:hypothetical protein